MMVDEKDGLIREQQALVTKQELELEEYIKDTEDMQEELSELQ
jgi:hypothetical protein